MASSEPGLEPAAPAGVTSFVIHGTGAKTPVSAAGTMEGQFADMQRQLREMAAELAASKLRQTHDEWGARINSPASPGSGAEVMADAIGKAVAQALESGKTSSIKVSPIITWPSLGDTDAGWGISKFFHDLEEIFRIDNGGKGMGHAERLVCLRMCLHGTRKMVYNNVEKSHDNDTVKETNPQLMYKEVKDELMR